MLDHAAGEGRDLRPRPPANRPRGRRHRPAVALRGPWRIRGLGRDRPACAAHRRGVRRPALPPGAPGGRGGRRPRRHSPPDPAGGDHPARQRAPADPLVAGRRAARNRARLVRQLHGLRRQGAGAGRRRGPLPGGGRRGRLRHRARRPGSHRGQAGPVRRGLRGRERLHVPAQRQRGRAQARPVCGHAHRAGRALSPVLHRGEPIGLRHARGPGAAVAVGRHGAAGQPLPHRGARPGGGGGAGGGAARAAGRRCCPGCGTSSASASP